MVLGVARGGHGIRVHLEQDVVQFRFHTCFALDGRNDFMLSGDPRSHLACFPEPEALHQGGNERRWWPHTISVLAVSQYFGLHCTGLPCNFKI